LRTVLQFLQENREAFATVPVAALGEDQQSAVALPHLAISVSAGQAIVRMAENAINDLIWWY
jgi:hypothetical protein